MGTATVRRAGFAGTKQLAGLAFWRDIVMLPVCVFGIAALLAITARDLRALYPTAASRLAVASRAGENPALRFLLGRLNGTSVGAFLAARWGVWGAAFAVLLATFIVVRHTRADEEAGRLELVGSAAVGRQAPLTAALVAAVTANAALALLTFLWLAVAKLPIAGSAALALSIAGCGLVFAGVAAVGAQLAVTARGARGIALAALGAAFVLRAVGDSASPSLSWLSWLSPLGWVELTRAFGTAGERWWVLILPLATSAALVAAAFGLAAWRDHGTGLLPDRPGPPRASGLLSGPFGLAWRAQRLMLAAWLAAFVSVFAACGAGARGAGSILGGNAVLRRYLLRIGYQATITDGYLSAVMLIAGLAAAAYATSAVLRLRTEETGNLADPVLAAATGRIRWGLSHISVALGGTCLLLSAAGLSAGLGYGIPAGSVSTQVPRMLGAALARLPATMVIAALAVLLFGLLPWESVALAWTVVALAGVIAVFGQALQWPAWMMDLSPFSHTPKLPGAAVSAAPLLWMCGIALVLGIVGLIGLRRRDLGDLGPTAFVRPVRDWLADYVRESAELSQQG
ncbi:MAG TPA: ABC transporter permease [Streptosporangiaceae bacterium]|nr:ABC transporter permease [Streptosporangiaceae bacterium]